MRIIIAGGRDFDDYELMEKSFDALTVQLDDRGMHTIISGTCRGADKLGERLAKAWFMRVEQYPAEWRVDGVYNPAAGFIRNGVMAENADVLLAFWDGTSKGTKHMIDIALAKGLLVKVVRYGK